MHEKLLFEYAIIRAVPRVERQEFINVGVILYCSALRFLDLQTALNPQKLLCISPEADFSLFENVLSGFQSICRGDRSAGPVARFPVAERFRWLTATRSTIIQTSPVHPGFCTHPSLELEKIFELMVKG